MTPVLSQQHPLRQEPHDSLADKVFEALKRDIVENRLPSETILAEAMVAGRHGVSRAPAREALKRLTTLGFVRAVPRLGYIVTSISVRDFDEILEMRLALEPLAVELAVPRLVADDFERLDALARRVREVPAEPLERHGALYAQLNADFHRAIARAAGNGRLEHTISRLIDELERMMHTLAYSGSIEQVLDQHLALLETMRTGDAKAAAAVMRDQLEQDYAVQRTLARPAANG
jgi:DNA-binding GntR family transcriptional regulator